MASQVRNGKAFEWAVGIEIVNNYGFELLDNEVAQQNKACFIHPETTEKQRENYQTSAEHAVKEVLIKSHKILLTYKASNPRHNFSEWLFPSEKL